MTICISVKVAEGLVLAADSVVTLQGEITTPTSSMKGILQTYEYANKVSQVKDYPIGVMTWGAASIQDRTIQSLVMEFEYDYPGMDDKASYTVKEIAEGLVKFIGERYDKAYEEKEEPQQPKLGLLIGGYSFKSFFSEQYIYEFPKPRSLERVRPEKEDGSPSFGSNWFGQIDALQRLIKGYDPRSLQELVEKGVKKELLEEWTKISELPILFDGMPLQDAVDFAEYAAQVVIGRWRFGLGVPLCGGDIDIAVIRPNSFQWSKRKQWAIK